MMATVASPSPIPLLCPNCSQALSRDSTRYSCPNCGRDQVAQGGVLDYVGAETEYWGEIPKAEMETMLEQASKNGSREAIALLTARHRELAGYLLSWSRSDWIFHWLGGRGAKFGKCADLGSGWGNLSLALARYF